MTSRPSVSATIALTCAVLMTACGAAPDGSAPPAGNSTSASPAATATPTSTSADPGMHHDHAMDGGPAPAGMAPATNPAHQVGDTVTLTADHMPGMTGAKATISGAFTTTTYEVSYTPTDGGAPVKNHRWVVNEELRAPGTAPLIKGAQIVIEAEHMPGMKGATGSVDAATDDTVYMVDYTTPDGMTMTRHKWVTESEIDPAD